MSANGAARRAYRWLLRMLPLDFRRQFGRDLEEVFVQRLEEAAGLGGRLWVWTRAIADVLGTAVQERLPRISVGGSGSNWVRLLFWDVRYSLRSVLRAPLFGLVAVGTLALGVGASVATFSVVHGALLKPLPYPDPERLVVVWPDRNFNNAMVRGVVESVPALQDVSGIGRWRLTLAGEGAAREVQADRVTPGYLATLGARPVLGRLLLVEDALPDAEDVAVISHAFWSETFGEDPNVIGRRVQLDGAGASTRTIVGVVPREFRSLGDEPDVWIAFEDDPALGIAEDQTWFVNDRIARLAPGATLQQARDQVRAFARRAQELVPTLIEEADVRTATVEPLQPYLTRSVRTALWVTLGVVSLVLLIACANVANLLLARGESRKHDLSVRVALGAGRAGVVRMLLAECVVLGLAGGALGVALSFALVRGLLAVAPSDFPRLHEVGIDPVVLGFAVTVTLAAILLAGISPALRISRVEGASRLGAGTRSVSARRRSRLSRVLVGAEVALAVVVAVGSGLMLRSLQQMLAVDTGLEGERVVVMSVAPPEWRYPDHPAFLTYYAQALTRLESVPGIESVGAINLLPGTTDNWSFPLYPEGVEYPEGAAVASVNFRVVLPGYFESVGIPLEQGRFLGGGDRADAESVVVVNRAFVNRFWPEDAPMGRSVRWFSPEARGYRVVGVVGDVRQHGMARETTPEVYVPYGQIDWIVTFWITARVQGTAPPLETAEALMNALWAVDPDVPISGVSTLETVYGQSAATTRFLAIMLSLFGLLALVLCASGVFGVTAFSVGQRTSEFGVRVALGSTRAGILEVALRSSLSPILAGVVVGIGVALLAGGVMESSLYEVQPTDPVALLTAGGMLLLVGLVAAAWPAWRASRVDPVQALASE